MMTAIRRNTATMYPVTVTENNGTVWYINNALTNYNKGGNIAD